MTLRHLAGLVVMCVLAWGILWIWVEMAISVITGSAWR